MDGCQEKEALPRVVGIARHRLVTDGEGVTTLVAFHGCPLRFGVAGRGGEVPQVKGSLPWGAQMPHRL